MSTSDQLATRAPRVPPKPPGRRAKPVAPVVCIEPFTLTIANQDAMASSGQAPAALRHKALDLSTKTLSDENSSLKERLAVCELELQDAQDESDDAIQAVIAKDRELAKIQSLLDAKQSELADLQAKTNKLSLQLETSLDVSKNNKHHLNDEVANELNKLKTENLNISIQLEASTELVRKLKEARGQAQDTDLSNKALETQVRELQNTLQVKEVEIDQMQVKMQDTKIELQCLRAQSDGQASENINDRKVVALNAELDGTRDLFLYLEDLCGRVGAENVAMKEENRALREAESITAQKYERQKRQIKELYDENSRLQH